MTPARIASLGFLLACAGCDLPASDARNPEAARSRYVLQLLPGPFADGIRVLPIRVEAWTPAAMSGDGSQHCVRLTGSPGTLSFPFADAADAGTADAGALRAEHPLRTRAEDGATVAKGHLLARYALKDLDEVATLFGDLLERSDCSGDVLAATAIVIDFSKSPAADASDADAGADDDAGESGP